MFQPAAFSLGSMRRLRVSHSELRSDAFTDSLEEAMNYTVSRLQSDIAKVGRLTEVTSDEDGVFGPMGILSTSELLIGGKTPFDSP